MGRVIKVAARRIGPDIADVAREVGREVAVIVARAIIDGMFGKPRRRRRF